MKKKNCTQNCLIHKFFGPQINTECFSGKDVLIKHKLPG